MKQYATFQFDNRDATQMYEYMEARIEALKRRVGELETQNAELRSSQFADEDADLSFIGSA